LRPRDCCTASVPPWRVRIATSSSSNYLSPTLGWSLPYPGYSLLPPSPTRARRTQCTAPTCIKHHQTLSEAKSSRRLLPRAWVLRQIIGLVRSSVVSKCSLTTLERGACLRGCLHVYDSPYDFKYDFHSTRIRIQFCIPHLWQWSVYRSQKQSIKN
jgi:hypothetical protein